MRLAVCLVVALLTVPALAAVIPVGPFVGDLQESWESFQNYWDDPDHFMDDPSLIFGGTAEISNAYMVVYEPSAGVGFGLGYYGNAQVVDGTKGHGLDTGWPASSATINFDDPVLQFGGYWGAADIDGYPTVPIGFDFYDGDGELIDSVTVQYGDDTGQGTLMWFGWSSDVGIETVVYTGSFVVNDYLQATLVPEPASLALLALGVLVLRRR
ncbi:MAG TPA: PEP-CTERM sorting domain-containing protein [Phycisphaerae bacterium]|nr:PEP-CTERM sorting domain-containing protein [Phycisphaerae bacterium]